MLETETQEGDVTMAHNFVRVKDSGETVSDGDDCRVFWELFTDGLLNRGIGVIICC
jgi:hypothetical protein